MLHCCNRMQCGSRRGYTLLMEESISEALGTLCNCTPYCSELWTRQALRQARQSHLTKKLIEQKQTVYDVLLGCRDPATGKLYLTIKGVGCWTNSLISKGKLVCSPAYMIYHGISHYQFYAALKCVVDGIPPASLHSNEVREYTAIKQTQCKAFLTRICSELAEGLPTGFKLELNKGVLPAKFPIINIFSLLKINYMCIFWKS